MYPGPTGEIQSANRKLFHEMVKSEMEERSLSWIQRRDLVRFAQSIRIDPTEAKLIIRAVEFEMEQAETRSTHENGKIQNEFIADPWPHTEKIYHYILISGWVLLVAGGFLIILRNMP